MTVTEQMLLPLVSDPAPGGARQSDPGTSHAVAHDHKRTLRWGSERVQLLAAYVDLGPSTDEQAGLRSGVRRVADTRRCSELRKAGLIEPTGAKRKTVTGADAMVCAVTQAGRDALYASRMAKR